MAAASWPLQGLLAGSCKPQPAADTFPARNLRHPTPSQQSHKVLPHAFHVLLRHVHASACHRQKSPMPDTILPSALQDLLKGISTRADVHVGNWAFHLADKLRRAWFPLVGSPPFAAHRGEEALEYAALPTLDR